MFVRGLVFVTLFTNLLGAAGQSDSDILSVRSFLNPNTKEKIPVTGQLFSDKVPELLTEELKKNDKCAIPLLEWKVGKTGDKIAKLVGPARVDPSSVTPPPVPACEAWTAAEYQSAPSSRLRWH
jgi:hypothetical protein